MRRHAGVGAVVLALATAEVVAHDAPFSYLDLQVEAGAVEARLVAHVIDIGHDLGLEAPEPLLDPGVVSQQTDAIHALLGSRLEIAADGQRLRPAWSVPEVLLERQALAASARYVFPATPGVLAVTGCLFPYDPNHQTFLNVYEGGELTAQAILHCGQPTFEYFSGTRQGALAVVRKFLPSGIHHILIGPDHLLFLIGLLLFGGAIRRLVLIVTAFTVAHSITLSLAVLSLLTPPASLIEPAIALSIMYVGADNLFVREGRDVRAWIAFVFGLIHGFGFANVLREMSLPSRALGWSLFSFNLGVEVGQLCVVVAVASALAALRARHEAAGRRLAIVGSLVVLAAGTFWFVQRAFFA